MPRRDSHHLVGIPKDTGLLIVAFGFVLFLRRRLPKAQSAGSGSAIQAPRSLNTPNRVCGRPHTDASERIDKMISDLGDWRGERMALIRKLIQEVDPEVVEEWKWKGTPVWSHNGMYALANAYKAKVSLVFHHGAELADPEKLFNNMLDGNKWRAIDYTERDEIDERALKSLLKEAIAYNGSHSVPKSKGSREALLKDAATDKRKHPGPKSKGSRL